MKIFAVILILFSMSSFAMTIQTKIINRTYTLDLTSSVIKIWAHDIDVSLVKSSCNERVFNQTFSYIKELTKLLKNHKASESESFVEVSDHKTMIDPFSRLADYFRELPTYLVESKLKERMVCGKSK